MKKSKQGRRIAACALGFAFALSLGVLSACNVSGGASGASDGGSSGTSGSSDVVLPPETEETYTVTFASESGTVYGTQTVEGGRKATLPEYTDRYGNAITQWYYKYANGATEYWSFAGYPVTENMTLYAVESDGAAGTSYRLDATFSAFINAMGGVEFGAGIYRGATITVLSEEEERYLLTMQTDKSSVTIYGVTCDTFIDPAATNATGEAEVPLGTIGYYDAAGNLVTEGVSYTLSDEGDTAYAPDPEGGSDYVSVRYVKEISMVLENVGTLADLDELEVTFFINSQVMGGQFCNSETSSTRSAGKLTISGMTQIEEEPEEPEMPAGGIAGATIDENGHLILTLSDGSELDAGLVKGEDGEQGVGILRIEYDAPTLHIYLSNGVHYQFDIGGEGGWSGLTAQVTAVYQMENPTDESLPVQMTFYLEQYRTYGREGAEALDTEGFSITADGEPVEFACAKAEADAEDTDRFALTYTVDFPAGAAREVAVSYPSRGLGRSDWSSHWRHTFTYLLSPARHWADFGTLDVAVTTPESSPYVIQSSLPLEEAGERRYTAHFDSLPDGELTFTLYPEPRITLADRLSSYQFQAFMMMGLPLLLLFAGLPAAAAAVLLVWLSRRARRKKAG